MVENKEIWIFLSHSNADFNKVRKIRNYLEEKSYRPLMFYLKCLESDEEIYNLIKREIDVRTRFILCDSENARGSYWVKKEMDYISNQNPSRSYLRIDLSQPEDAIYRKIDSYVNEMNIYISCSRQQNDLLNKVQYRLNKYELKVLYDSILSYSGLMFDQEIYTQISHAANNGFFVFLYSKDIIDDSFAIQEFKLAYKLGANVILITLDQESAQICSNNGFLQKFQHINVSDSSDEDKSDAVVNQILDEILPVGGLMTYAENFRTGRLCIKDYDEAIKLEKYLRKKAENSANPAALEYIGKCYEYGLGGETVDLHKAMMYYHERINEQSSDELLEHIKKLNAEIYGDSALISKSPENFMRRIKSIFKK